MPTRRDALRALGGFAALPFLGSLSVDELRDVGERAHARAAGHAPRALTGAQHAVVEAAAERIIPRTNTPGASDARVADFVDVMLADWYTPAERDRFIAGLSDLDDGARRATGQPFVRTSVARQAALLEAIDREPRAGDHWFSSLKFLTVWGYYTSRPGIVDELRVELTPGRYDGNAPY
jgi:hypothetical protein